MIDLLFHLGAIAVIVFSVVLWFIFCMKKLLEINDNKLLGFGGFVKLTSLIVTVGISIILLGIAEILFFEYLGWL